MWDILTFRKMLTPSLLQLLFWLGMLMFIVNGILTIIHQQPLLALGWLIAAPLALRVIVELMMCFFAINNQLNSLRHLLGEQIKPTVKE